MGKLTDRSAKTLAAGKHGDGDGLTLVVTETGSRRWFLRFQMGGRRRDMGLGSYPEVSLSAARAAAAAARSLAAQGIDPLAAREASKKAEQPVPTFSEIATEVIAEARKRTASAKVSRQWERYLGPAYCSPLLNRPVHELTTSDVISVLRPVWHSKPEAARKAYPAIRRVFEAARIKLRDQHGIIFENPARWEDIKAVLVEAPKKLSRGSHPSLPYDQMPAFMAALRERKAVAARMLEFQILTNVRGGAARNATFDQFDLEAGIWFVPITSLKDKKHRKEAFRVPLSRRAIDIVREMETNRISSVVFPNAKGKPFTDNAVVVLLKRMNGGETNWLDPDGRQAVAHGFRATFKTWAEEAVSFPHHTIEEAMGHVIGSAVERVYRRTDLLEQRRALMTAWQNHCEPSPADNVLRFPKSGGAA